MKWVTVYAGHKSTWHRKYMVADMREAFSLAYSAIRELGKQYGGHVPAYTVDHANGKTYLATGEAWRPNWAEVVIRDVKPNDVW
jgi:hypothetical protein